MLKHRLKTPNKRLLFSFLCFILGTALFVLVNARPSYAANPTTINFQGKVVNADGTNVTNGTYSFIFRIYNTASPTTTTACTTTASCLWEETQGSVTITNGVFQVELGSVCALTSSSCNNSIGGPINWNSTSSLFLTLKFNSDSAGFMSPTMHITSVPFAFNADQLGGISASGFIQNGSGLQSSSNFHISGTGVSDTQLQSPLFDTATVSGTLGFGTTNAGAITVGSTTSGTTVTIRGGTTANTAISLATNGSGGITIDSGTTGSINIGNGANAKAVGIGNTTNGTTITQTAGALTNTLSNSGDAIKTATNSTTAFSVENSASTNVLNVDTSTNNANNLLTNPSIESAISGNWTAKNGSGASTPTQVTTPAYNAAHSLQVVTSGTATNAGATESVALSNNTFYSLSVYVNSLSGFISTAGAGTFDMGFGSGGADTSCLTAQKAPQNSWTRFTCSFDTGTLGASPYIYFKQTDATGRTFYIDSTDLETDTNATTKWQDGTITLNGTINSQVVISPQQDSSNALLVQTSEGINIFGVDTTDTNLINNPGLEVNTTNWSYSGTQSTIVGIFRDVTNSYLGVASLKFIMSATATDQAKFTFSPNTLLQASTTYTLSFYAKDSATSYSTLTFGRHENTTDTSCVTTGTITTQWQRFSCSFTIGATIGASPYIYISAGTASKTIFIDAVSLEPGSTATPYGTGNIYLNGVVNSPVNFQNKTDSTTAFQIQNSSSIAMLSADTANVRIQVGSSVAHSANPVILVLDNYNNATEPTEVNGAMYYNASTSTMRCGVAGSWENCVGGILSSSFTSATTLTGSTTTIQNFSVTGNIPANYCVSGRIIHVIAAGHLSTTTTAESIVFTIRAGGTPTTVGTASQAMTPAASLTSRGWGLDFNIICTAAPGGSAAVLGEGSSRIPGTTSTASDQVGDMGSGATASLATNGALAVDVSITFAGTASASNTITLDQLILEGK